MRVHTISEPLTEIVFRRSKGRPMTMKAETSHTYCLADSYRYDHLKAFRHPTDALELAEVRFRGRRYSPDEGPRLSEWQPGSNLEALHDPRRAKIRPGKSHMDIPAEQEWGEV